VAIRPCGRLCRPPWVPRFASQRGLRTRLGGEGSRRRSKSPTAKKGCNGSCRRRLGRVLYRRWSICRLARPTPQVRRRLAVAPPVDRSAQASGCLTGLCRHRLQGLGIAVLWAAAWPLQKPAPSRSCGGLQAAAFRHRCWRPAGPSPASGGQTSTSPRSCLAAASGRPVEPAQRSTDGTQNRSSVAGKLPIVRLTPLEGDL
jgi:hypothetical protein